MRECSTGIYGDGLVFQKVLAASDCIVPVQNCSYPCLPLHRNLKLQKTRQVMMLRDSKDEEVKEANVDVRTGRKWVAKDAVEDAESRLRHKDIVGVVTSGRLGFGNIQQPLWESADDRQRRDLVQQEVRRGEEEERQVKAVGMKQQGQYTRWEQARPRKITWQ